MRPPAQIGDNVVRILAIGMVCCAVCVIATRSSAGRPQPPLPGDGAEINQLLTPYVPQSLDFDKEIAGLSHGSRPEILTWDRIYALALVRARSIRGAFAPSLDPTALDKEAARQGVGDFARFRKEFLSGRVAAGGAFRDPSAQVFGLLGRLYAIDNTRHVVALHDNLHQLIRERSQAESSGVNRLDVDLVRAASVRARQNLSDEITQFRDGLDQLKFILGLSPHAAVILDRQSLAPFRAAQESVASWTRMPKRNPQTLHDLIGRFPALGEVVLDKQPLLAQAASNPDRLEEILTNAAQLAVKNQNEREKASAFANTGVQLELQVRRRIRGQYDALRTYEREKQLYELAIRAQDQTFERLVAPAAGVSSSRSPLLERLIEQITQIKKLDDHLVAIWTSFRAERLALYRDLGELPYDHWKSFIDDLAAAQDGAGANPGNLPKPAAVDAPGALAPPAAPISGANADDRQLPRARFPLPRRQSSK
jgi:hypothetical protein